MNEFAESGCQMVPSVLSPEQISLWQHSVVPLLEGEPAGVRGLAQRLDGLVRELAGMPAITSLVMQISGPHARLVRSILFNKSAETNWQVGWHQDLSIAVRQREEIAGFTAWSIKEGVLHVQPPASILENMVTVRIHLDDAFTHNGTLWVAPGTHRFGRLNSDEIGRHLQRVEPVPCVCSAGDLLLMRPLLLHASFKAISPQPRRVIHLEFAATDLPLPLQWQEG